MLYKNILIIFKRMAVITAKKFFVQNLFVYLGLDFWQKFSYFAVDLGVIAQLGERLNGIQEVRSSILLSSTSFAKGPSDTAGLL